MISDASPLINFAKLNKIDILVKTVGKLEIGEAVLKEITQKDEKAEESEIIKNHIKNGNIIVKKLKRENLKKLMQIGIIFKGLGFGELEAIALAIQENEKKILIDDSKARDAARLNGIKPVGTLRILLLAYEHGILSEKETGVLFKQMVENKFWISGDIVVSFFEAFEKLKRKKK